jgi:hypothetical protein
MASLLTLTTASPSSLNQRTPRQLLSTVEPAWEDDLAAWGLVQRFVRLARQRLRETQESASDTSRANEGAKARWAYGVSLDLYDELRLRAIKARTKSATTHS